jgi:formate/nitrite transporter FocA (FNT family)
VNEEITPRKVAVAIGTIATIWNIIGSILLALSTAIFHSVELTQPFLPAFHSAINCNILFAALVFIAAVMVRMRLKAR